MPTRAARPLFDADDALRFARALVDTAGPRPAGSDEERVAREQLATALRAEGWSVVEEDVPLPQGGISANLVSWRGDADPRAGPHVVVGAHVDTVAGSPGANDNASGLAVLVGVARLLSDDGPALPVVLVGFGAEEYQPPAAPDQPRQHHLGSEVYAHAHGGQVVAMLSVDMVGNGDTTCVCWFSAGPPTLAERLAEVAASAGIAGVEVRREGDISDHGPFARRGVPAAFLWTGRDGRYHTAADTAEHLRPGDLRRAGDLVTAFLWSLHPEEVGGLQPGAGSPTPG